MNYESLPAKALVIWELLALLIGFGLFQLVLFIFTPYTIVWYIIVWLLGALVVLTCFLYLPLLYISSKFALTDQFFVFKNGVVFNKTHYLKRETITFVSLYRNPFTPLLNLSSLLLTSPGAHILILFLPHSRALELANALSFEHKFKEL